MLGIVEGDGGGADWVGRAVLMAKGNPVGLKHSCGKEERFCKKQTGTYRHCRY